MLANWFVGSQPGSIIFWAAWEHVNTQLHLVSWEGTYQTDSTFKIFQPNQ